MIAIDMEMPENCARCMFRSISSALLKETFVCYATLPRRPLAEATPDERLRFKPSWCPLIDLSQYEDDLK
jgi:hypothetical protein